jgi:diketogulonate reductase-like aldo/keto reductase
MQVHNLLDWDTHLGTLREWKAAGRIRYLGVTTSHGRRHEELEHLMRTQTLDFVQFTYNLAETEAEQRLLPLAAERGIAVIINRPFDGGNLFDVVRGETLSGWAAEIGCANWAQVFLKFVVSHPAVACAIPATSQLAHMQENMGALAGPLPDAALRKRMLADFRALS